MLPSVKNESGAKTKVPSKRELKKRINIRWNSRLYFQVGLVAILLLTFLVMESDWDLGAKVDYKPYTGVTIEDPAVFVFKLEPPKIAAVSKPKKIVKPRVIQKTIATKVTVVDNDSKSDDTPLKPTEIVPGLVSTGVGAPPVKKEPASTTFKNVQFVPIFPGCESLRDNSERRACMSSKVTKFINRRFNTDKFSELEPGKVHTVRVQFTVGRDGSVKDILARAQLPGLEEEAKRVIGKMPMMQPGKQGNTEVDVIFTVPIAFKVQ